MGVLNDVVDSTVNAVKDAVRSVISIGGGGGGGNAVNLGPEVEQLAILIAWVARVVDDTYKQAADQAAVATLLATGIGGDIDNLSQQYKFAFEHTYKTVIPHSLDWLEGSIVRKYVTPLRQRVGKVETRTTALEKWRADIHDWRVNIVDPTLNDYRQFAKFWNGWPRDVVNTLHTWLQKPGVFADFAVPAVAQPLVGYYGDGSHQTLTDAFVGILLDASPSRYRHAIAAFERMLDQEYP